MLPWCCPAPEPGCVVFTDEHPLPPRQLVVSALGGLSSPLAAVGAPGFAGSPAELLSGESVLMPAKRKKKDKKVLNQPQKVSGLCRKLKCP